MAFGCKRRVRIVRLDEDDCEERHDDTRHNEVAAEVDDEDEKDEHGNLILDDEEEEDDEKESRDEVAKAKKKKGRRRDAEEQYKLDEDNYELLEEANFNGYHRPKFAKTNFKRLKKAGEIGRVKGVIAQRIFLDGEDLEEGNFRSCSAEEELQQSLFRDDEVVTLEDLGNEDEEEDIGDEDEIANSIVGNEEMDENGQHARWRKAKQRGGRQAAGISSIALQDVQEIFHDVEELLNCHKVEINEAEGELRTRTKKMLEKDFEPSILEEKYMTTKDDYIRELDMPERLQFLQEIINIIPSKESKLKEAEWIYDRAFGTVAVPMRKEFCHLVKMERIEVIQQIGYVLAQLHNNKIEIAFIGMYRKEGCLDLVKEPNELCVNPQDEEIVKLKYYKALWQVQFWDRKWSSLEQRKGALKMTYEKRARAEAAVTPSTREFLHRLLASLQDADSEQVVDDVHAKFQIYFPPDEMELGQGNFKRPKQRSLYTIYLKARLGRIAKYMGLTPEQFGENLEAMYKKHELIDPSSIPEDIVKTYSTGELRDFQSVLQGARHMASVEMSTEPAVRKYVREIYMKEAVVTTKPTAEGNAVIDPFHQYANVKWLLNKPVNAFDDAQWLLIQKAEEEKLLEVNVGLPKEVVNDTLMQEFETLYLSDGVSRVSQLWNEQRKHILKDAVSKFLLPVMQKEARVMLTVRAKHWVAMECLAQLWKKVSVAPHPLPKSDPSERSVGGGVPRVMACCWGCRNPATTFVILDSFGEIVNTLHTPYLTIRNGSHEHLQRKKNDQQRLLKFMMKNQPQVVILGAANLMCRQLKDDISETIFMIGEEHPRDLAEGIDMINVVYGDEALPKLYEHSQVSLEQLPGQPGIVRRAVALGRYLQNPLAMVASLCGPKKEILSFKIHQLQKFLSSDELYDVIEQVMVTVTNQVGVDVNLAAAHEWLFAPLQFVSGLGPRKASMMQRSIQGARQISTRKEMLTSLCLMKKNVFINACGFLRICGSGQGASGNQTLDPLDDTRIHPESYDLAKKMLNDVYRDDQHLNPDDMDEEMHEVAFEHVKENRSLIKNLDIVEYARILQKRDGVCKLETLNDIKLELLVGYKDWRVPYSQPSQDEEFSLLTGEDDETLADGRIVTATVFKVQHSRVLCRLESGLLGVVEKNDFSDEPEFHLSEKVSVGGIITCCVKGLQKAMYLVNLTCRVSGLEADVWQSKQPKDQYYVQNNTLLHTDQEKEKKEIEDKKNKSFQQRMIVHPHFQNISMADAVETLEHKEAGCFIIRPSSKGPSQLSLTLKAFDQVYSHIDIVEIGKDTRDFTSFLRLGKMLKIGDGKYEGLDEVISQYVDPLVNNLKALLKYSKFRSGTKSQVAEFLKQEKLQYPNGMGYCFSVSYDHHGAFMLSYICTVDVHHEYVSLSPKGYIFRKLIFKNLNNLVSFISKHMDTIVDNPPHWATAAMAPMKRHVPGGIGSESWGGSNKTCFAESTSWHGHANRRVDSDRASTPGSRSIGNRDKIAPGGMGSGSWGGSNRASFASSTTWRGRGDRRIGGDRAPTPGLRSVGNWDKAGSKSDWNSSRGWGRARSLRKNSSGWDNDPEQESGGWGGRWNNSGNESGDWNNHPIEETVGCRGNSGNESGGWDGVWGNPGNEIGGWNNHPIEESDGCHGNSGNESGGWGNGSNLGKQSNNWGSNAEKDSGGWSGSGNNNPGNKSSGWSRASNPRIEGSDWDNHHELESGSLAGGCSNFGNEIGGWNNHPVAETDGCGGYSVNESGGWGSANNLGKQSNEWNGNAEKDSGGWSGKGSNNRGKENSASNPRKDSSGWDSYHEQKNGGWAGGCSNPGSESGGWNNHPVGERGDCGGNSGNESGGWGSAGNFGNQSNDWDSNAEKDSGGWSGNGSNNPGKQSNGCGSNPGNENHNWGSGGPTGKETSGCGGIGEIENVGWVGGANSTEQEGGGGWSGTADNHRKEYSGWGGSGICDNTGMGSSSGWSGSGSSLGTETGGWAGRKEHDGCGSGANIGTDTGGWDSGSGSNPENGGDGWGARNPGRESGKRGVDHDGKEGSTIQEGW